LAGRNIGSAMFRRNYLTSFIRSLAILLFLILICIFTVNKIHDFDIWYHLSAGKYIVQNQRIPSQDFFSYTAVNHLWIDLHWLFQVLLFTVYENLGVNGLTLLNSIIIIFAFIFLSQVHYRKDNFNTVLSICLLVILSGHGRFMVRPEIFSLLFIALYLFVLYEYKYENRNHTIWLLPILQLLWVNMQGLFILGLVLIYGYLFGELICWKIKLPFQWNNEFTIKEKKYWKLLLVGILSLVVCFINPYGFKGALFPFTLFSNIGTKTNIFAQTIHEFQRPFAIQGWNLKIFFYKILLFTSFFTCFLNIIRLDLSHFMIYCSFLYLSTLAVRNITLFGFVAAPLMVANLKDFFRTRRLSISNSNTWKNLGGLILSILIVFIIVGVSRAKSYREKIGFGIMSLHYPKKMCDFMEENKIFGNIFNEQAIGGYLIWRLYPRNRVFIDGRLEVYGKNINALYQEVFRDYSLWNRLIEPYKINCVALAYRLNFPKEFLHKLDEDKEWNPIYVDEVALLFLRNIPRNNTIIRKVTEEFKTPYFHHFRAELFKELELKNWAIREYQKIIRFEPDDIPAHNNLGTLYIEKGDNEKALKEFEEVLRINPNLVAAINNLGIVYRELERYEEAVNVYKRGLEISPQTPQLHFNLGVTYEKMGQFDKSVTEYQKTLTIDPNYAEARKRMEKLMKF